MEPCGWIRATGHRSRGIDRKAPVGTTGGRRAQGGNDQNAAGCSRCHRMGRDQPPPPDHRAIAIAQPRSRTRGTRGGAFLFGVWRGSLAPAASLRMPLSPWRVDVWIDFGWGRRANDRKTLGRPAHFPRRGQPLTYAIDFPPLTHRRPSFHPYTGREAHQISRSAGASQGSFARAR